MYFLRNLFNKKPKELHLVEPSKNEKELTSLKIQNQELKNKNENLQEERIELVNKYDDKLIQLSQKFNELYMQHSSTENNSNPSEQEESFKKIAADKSKETQRYKTEFKKNRDIVRKLRIVVINKLIIPTIKNINHKQLPEEPIYGYDSTSKSFNVSTSKYTYIILDTNIFFYHLNPLKHKKFEDGEYQKENFTDEHLINLLNRIQRNKNLIPIITKEIAKELKCNMRNFSNDLNDQYTSDNEQIWLDLFPASLITKFLADCFYEPSQNQKFNSLTNEQITLIETHGILREFEKKALAPETPQGKYDKNHAAKTKAINAILVSEDGGLLGLKNNSHIKLNVYPLYEKHPMKNYNQPINDTLKELGFK